MVKPLDISSFFFLFIIIHSFKVFEVFDTALGYNNIGIRKSGVVTKTHL